MCDEVISAAAAAEDPTLRVKADSTSTKGALCNGFDGFVPPPARSQDTDEEEEYP